MAKKAKKNINSVPVAAQPLVIKRPLLWLVLASIVLYLPTLSMAMTDLDDGFFIVNKSDFCENLQNLFFSFRKTLWDTQADLMYRPVSTDILILNYQIANHGANIALFHLVNLLLHVCSVVLLYRLFIKLGIKPLHAFILSLVFAVHPVLTGAVAWISARIETLLCIFVLAFFLRSIDYANKGKIKDQLLSLLFLLLALFTKETAVMAAPAAFILLVVVLQKQWRSKQALIQYGSWMACYLIFFIARSLALRGKTPLPYESIFAQAPYRMLTMVQYTGKIFFPFNLSVFPLQQDIGYYYGIAAVLLLVVLLVLNKKRNLKLIIAGSSIFALFLLPTFFIPKNANIEIFEYRVYIPFTGILLLLTQTAFFQNKLDEKQMLIRSVLLCCILAGINFCYQQSFADPLSFWTQAERSSPHSAYAKMMLSARINDPTKSDSLFLEAFQIDPNERMLNFIYGVRLQNKDSILASEKYFLAEKNKSGYYKCDFYLARVSIAKNDKNAAIAYLESYLKNDKTNPGANKNLLLLYLDTEQDGKAKEQAIKMREEGIEVPKGVLQYFNL